MAQKKSQNWTDYLANERTFLAWIRTSLGLMAFGFLIERFSLFMSRLAYTFQNPPLPQLPPSKSSAPLFGIALVLFGLLIGVGSYLKYKQIEKQIKEGSPHRSSLLVTLVLVAIFLTGCLLSFYLISLQFE